MDTWYIVEGRLHCTDAGGPTRSVQSPFVQDALQRNERARQLDGWKTAQPDDDGGGRMVPRAVLWGSGRSGGGALTHRFRYVTRGDDGSVYYVISVANATALFRYFPREDREIRLFHALFAGDEHVAARHVVTFDVGADDSVVYSNGDGVFRLVDGDWQPIASANLVENVCA